MSQSLKFDVPDKSKQSLVNLIRRDAALAQKGTIGQLDIVGHGEPLIPIICLVPFKNNPNISV